MHYQVLSHPHLKILNILCVWLFCQCSVCRSQTSSRDSLELELETASCELSYGCWESLEVLSTAEPSLSFSQALHVIFPLTHVEITFLQQEFALTSLTCQFSWCNLYNPALFCWCLVSVLLCTYPLPLHVFSLFSIIRMHFLYRTIIIRIITFFILLFF